MTGTYWATEPQWQAGQDRRCGELVLQYFATIADVGVRQQVAFECRDVIRQLNIVVSGSILRVLQLASFALPALFTGGSNFAHALNTHSPPLCSQTAHGVHGECESVGMASCPAMPHTGARGRGSSSATPCAPRYLHGSRVRHALGYRNVPKCHNQVARYRKRRRGAADCLEQSCGPCAGCGEADCGNKCSLLASSASLQVAPILGCPSPLSAPQMFVFKHRIPTYTRSSVMMRMCNMVAGLQPVEPKLAVYVKRDAGLRILCHPLTCTESRHLWPISPPVPPPPPPHVTYCLLATPRYKTVADFPYHARNPVLPFLLLIPKLVALYR
jgi:hypothetical protein